MDFAHDMANDTSAWSGHGDIVLEYCRAYNFRHRWSKISDVYECVWGSEPLLLLLCELAGYDVQLHTQITSSLQRGLTGEQLLLDVIPSCLSTLANVVTVDTSKATGAVYRRSTAAFLALNNLLVMVSMSKRKSIMRLFLKEQILFHFYFDQVIPAKVSKLSTEFRHFLDICDFPSPFQFVRFASNYKKFDVLDFLHKYLVYPHLKTKKKQSLNSFRLYVIPTLRLDQGEEYQKEILIKECLEIVLVNNNTVSL